MKLKSAAMTHIGKVRHNNEDNFYLNGNYRFDVNSDIKAVEDNRRRRRYIYAVFDGMGGENCGELASLKAVELLHKYDKRNIRSNIDIYVSQANNEVCNIIGASGMGQAGTTLALFVSNGETADLYNIGDSRVYRLQGEVLDRLSKDHTQAQDLIDAGIMTENDSTRSSKGHILTQHLGIPEDEFIIEPNIITNVELKKDDIFLLCSDGLSDMLEDSVIKEILKKGCCKEPKEIVSMLIKASLVGGGRDNVTAIVIKVY